MKKFLSSFAVFAASIFFVGCGQQVEVPPAHVGKIMTKDGYQDNLIPTSKFRLEPCISYCDRLVTLDVSDSTFNNPMVIFMPTDKLNLSVSVQTTLSINQKKTAEIFNAISPAKDKEEGEYLSRIDKTGVYKTYAEQIIVTESREYLSKFTIGELASSIEQINSELRNRISKALAERTPFSVRYVGITNIAYPKIITDAQENAAKRREQIETEEAQLAISKVTMDRDLQEARMARAIAKEKAETEAEAQRIQAQTIDPRVMELRKIENQAAWIDKWNGQLPTTTMGDAVPLVNFKF
jgi:hypothetical protein